MVEARDPSISILKLQFLHKAALTRDSPHPSSGISTPPLHTPASVPFKWEEEPGKPRLCTPIIATQPSKCLELPPACRMLLFTDDDAPPSKTPSPTTLLDGPYDVGRPKFSSFRLFREGKDSLSLDSRTAAFRSNKGGGQKTRGRFFGKLRSGGKKVVDAGEGDISEYFSTTSGSGSSNSSEERMMGAVVGRKMGRHESFSGDAHATNNKSSHIWATMYQGLKQVVQRKSSRKPNQQAAPLKEERSSPNFIVSFHD